MYIRALTLDDDLSDVIRLSRAFFDEYARHEPTFFGIDTLEDADITTFFGRSLADEDGATFVAVIDGQIVGYIAGGVRAQPAFYQVKQVGAISGLMVRADHRREGIASALLREMIAFFGARGATHYTAYTAAANEGAIRFYARHGMRTLHVNLLATVD